MKRLHPSDTLRDLSILLGITLVLGVYMIANTAVISKDGVLYIERAQQLPTQFSKILNANEPFGFPAMIFATHRFFSLLFSESASLWILSGQICVFLCRFLTMGVLYFFGKALFNRKQAFWGVGVLIFLPYPAEFGSDILREWPHLLFLFSGLLCLQAGIRKEHWGYLFTAGLLSGLGYLIRPECALVILYGGLFFIIGIVTAHKTVPAVRENWFFVMLLVGFLVIFIPYAHCVNNAIPRKLEKLYQKQSPPKTAKSAIVDLSHRTHQTGTLSGPGKIIEAEGKLFQRFSENLIYFFVLPAVIGGWHYFSIRQKNNKNGQWLIGMFIVFYVLILCLLHINWGYISRRHVLPLTVMSCFFIPKGIDIISEWLNSLNKKKQGRSQKWFILLVAIGIAICLPKLLRPLGYDKAHYRKASAWIAENTPPRARFYTFDKRIPFYAGHPYRIYRDDQRFKKNFKQRYLIVLSKDMNIALPPGMTLQAEFPSEKKRRAVLIYKRMRRVTDPYAPIPQK